MAETVFMEVKSDAVHSRSAKRLPQENQLESRGRMELEENAERGQGQFNLALRNLADGSHGYSLASFFPSSQSCSYPLCKRLALNKNVYFFKYSFGKNE